MSTTTIDPVGCRHAGEARAVQDTAQDGRTRYRLILRADAEFTEPTWDNHARYTREADGAVLVESRVRLKQNGRRAGYWTSGYWRHQAA